jgi:hypothetical protein
MKNQTTALPTLYTITAGDLGALFASSGVTGNDLSPYSQMAAGPDQTSSAELQRLMASPDGPEIARLLQAPELRIRCHACGGMAQEEVYYLLLSASTMAVLAQFTDAEGRLKLLLFPDGSGFLNWWISLYGTSDSHSYREIFPGHQDLETLVCACHALDLYRRAALESMLRYEAGGPISISPRDFIQGLKEAIVKGDNRWLLPSLINLTPGLKTHKLVLAPQHLKILEELGFIQPAENGAGETLTLGKLAVTLGTEFAATWMGSVGFEAVALVNGQKTVLDRKILMPTAFTNHLIALEPEPGGLKFQHQALDSGHLITLLEQWLGYLKKIAFTTAVPETEPPQAARFCQQCGAPLKAGRKFCTKCGTPVEH